MAGKTVSGGGNRGRRRVSIVKRWRRAACGVAAAMVGFVFGMSAFAFSFRGIRRQTLCCVKKEER